MPATKVISASSKLKAFFTSRPSTPAPRQHCPRCGLELSYRETVIGTLERWDYFDCQTCGSYAYRFRTHQLGRLADPDPNQPSRLS